MSVRQVKVHHRRRSQLRVGPAGGSMMRYARLSRREPPRRRRPPRLGVIVAFMFPAHATRLLPLHPAPGRSRNTIGYP